MGNSSSNSKIISLSNAQKRCAVCEWTEYNDGFDRLAEKDDEKDQTGYLTRDKFITHVLGRHIPVSLAMRLFHVFSFTGSGQKGSKNERICKKEFLCGLTILRHGTVNERLAFLFMVYDENGNEKISRKEMNKYLSILKDVITDTEFVTSLKEEYQRVSLYSASDELDFKQFNAWALSVLDLKTMTPGIITWVWDILPLPKRNVEADASRAFSEDKDNMKSLYGLTSNNSLTVQFNRKEIRRVENAYHQMLISSPSLIHASSLLKPFFPPSIPSALLDKIAKKFDKDDSGKITAQQFVKGMGIFCRGRMKEKQAYFFSLFVDDNIEYLKKWLVLSSPQEEHQIMKPYIEAGIRDCEHVYLISSNWYRAWLDYVGFNLLSSSEQQDNNNTNDNDDINELPSLVRQKSSLRPTTIDNSSLLVVHHSSITGQTDIDTRKTENDDEEYDEEDDDEEEDSYSDDVEEEAQDDDDENELDLDVEEGLNKDFVCVSPRVWSTLVNWYGGGPAIKRRTIDSSSITTTTTNNNNKEEMKGDSSSNSIISKVELYPLTLFLSFTGDNNNNNSNNSMINNSFKLVVSKYVSTSILAEKIRHGYGLEKKEIKLFDVIDIKCPKVIELNDNLTLEEIELVHRQTIYVDIKMSNGKFKGPPKSTISMNEDNNMMDEESQTISLSDKKQQTNIKNNKKEKEKKALILKGNGLVNGLLGFYNLGNTCFMNSSLQSLLASYPLSTYFFSNFYKTEVNKENPLGHAGEVAVVYGRLVKSMWLQKAKLGSAMAPRDVKKAIGKIAPRFIGIQQQDAQEFLNFLLDGLHEDLNRVIKKPYYPEPLSSDGLPADKSTLWERKLNQRKLCSNFIKRYLSRNQSIIVDLFTGVLKSTLSFSCGYESITFDPFLTLSLPIPEGEDELASLNQSKYTFDVLFFFDDPRRLPTKLSICMEHDNQNNQNDLTILQLKNELEDITGIYSTCIQMADIQSHIVWRFLSNSLPLSKVYASCSSNAFTSSASLFAYEIPPPKLTEEDVLRRHAKREKRRLAKDNISSIPIENQQNEEKKDDAKEQEQEQVFNPLNVKIGELVDVLDTARKWLLCEVLDKKKRKFTEQVITAEQVDEESSDDDDNNIDNDKPMTKEEEEKQIAYQKLQEQRKREQAARHAKGLKPIHVKKVAPPPHGDEIFVFIHYVGWADRWDEWISITSQSYRFALKNTKSEEEKIRTEAAKRKAAESNNSNNKDERLLSLNRNKELDLAPKALTFHLIHRKEQKENCYFLDDTKLKLFSYPILIWCEPTEINNSQLYQLVWEKVERFTETANDDNIMELNNYNHYTSSRMSLDDLRKQQDDNNNQTLSTFPPFLLRTVQRNGRYCSSCPWIANCQGCVLPYSNAPIDPELLMNDMTIAIDWNPKFITPTQITKMKAIYYHQSFEDMKKKLKCKILPNNNDLISRKNNRKKALQGTMIESASSLLLQDCIAEFTTEEELEEAPRCAKCKDYHDGTKKKLTIWQFPPVFVIHLKRLLHGRKIYKKINCPLTDFDPSVFLDSHVMNSSEEERAKEEEEESKISSSSSSSKNIKVKNDDNVDDNNEPIQLQGRNDTDLADDKTYDLFATVNHFGSAGGGHYTSFILNSSDNQWYCMDDEKVTVLPKSHPIVTEASYMLFYQRKGLNTQNAAQFLPKSIRDRLEKEKDTACTIS